AARVRRGQRGRAEAKRAAGGLSYGYRVIREIGSDGEVERGRREIDQDIAPIIVRIFSEYVAGRSARAIAADLNREGTPRRRGGLWNASTINGNRKRLTASCSIRYTPGKCSMAGSHTVKTRIPDRASRALSRRRAGFMSMCQSGGSCRRTYGKRLRRCACT